MSNLSELFEKSQVAISLGKYNLVIKFSQEALSIEPNNVVAYYNLALAYLYLKNYDKAVEFIKLAISIEPNWDDCLVLYCVILIKKEQYEPALKKADEALKISPNNEIAMYFKACIFNNLKNNTFGSRLEGVILLMRKYDKRIICNGNGNRCRQNIYLSANCKKDAG